MREMVGRSVCCSKSTSNGSQQRLDEVRDRTVALDRRTGITPDLYRS
jgi:hypothetical protein